MRTLLGIVLAAIVVTVTAGIVAVAGISSIAAQAAPSASRSFDSASVAPGGRVVVTINASNYGQAGGVTETLPAGFSHVSTSGLDASQVRVSGQDVRFILQGETSFSYTVTASSTPGDYPFDGTLRDSDRNDHAVGGATSVTVTAPATRTPSATRSFSSASVTPGARVTVTIRASNYGQAGGVTDTLPAGFSYVSSSLDASQVRVSGQDVRFILQGDASFTYTVTAASTPGSHPFSGTLRDSDRNDHTVGGPSRLRVRAAGGGGGGAPPANRAPVFGEGESASRSVAENSAPGTAVGLPVTATDRDRDRLTYSLSGAAAALFAIDPASGQIAVAQGADLDFESQASHAVGVEARDPSGSRDTISIAIAVTNVDEDGAVTLSPGQPQIGTEITATLTDPDGAVADLSWQWERSPDSAAWTAISGAGSNAYTPVEVDQGHYLRVTVAYADGHGGGKRAAAALPGAVPAPESMPPESMVTPAPQSVTIDVTVWRSVEAGDIFLSTRPEGGGWTTHNTPIDLSNLSSSGRFHQGLPVTVSVDVGGGESVTIDVTVWRSVRTGNIYVSTRPEGGGWTTHNTPIDLSNLSRSGRFYQGEPLPVEVKLP